MADDAESGVAPVASASSDVTWDDPSAFFLDCAPQIAASREVGPALDLACGRGRHGLAAAALGLDVLAVDRNAESLDALSAVAARDLEGRAGRITTWRADLEASPPPSLPVGPFGLVMVFRYLHRPLFPWIQARLAIGGWLVYETFTVDQRALGWGPRRADFLLEHGELPTLVPDLAIERYEEGPSKDAPPARTARLLAKRAR